MSQTPTINIDREKGNFRFAEDYSFDAGYGLNEGTLDYISGVKEEEPWPQYERKLNEII